jgi:hypothetical protein
MNNRYFRMSVVRWAAPLLTLVAAIVAGTLFGVQLVVLTLAAAALLLVIFLLWSSVQALAGESELTFEEAFSFGARSAEEEQKRAVLRALKDLEYERSVGKISEEDYHEYAARYRAEAKRLIQNLNEHLADQRQQVERELERRLAKAGSKAGAAQPEPAPNAEAASAPDASDEPAKIEAENAGKVRLEGLECPSCQVQNELDARFCKACGRSLIEAEESAS